MNCALTGHRVLGKDFNVQTLRVELEELIRRGADVFYCGMALGFDLVCCQELIALRERYPIRIVACRPCPDQEAKFSILQRELYHKCLWACDENILVSETYTDKCMLERNDYMVDRAEIVYAYYHEKQSRSGTGHTVRYAAKKGRQVIRYGTIAGAEAGERG